MPHRLPPLTALRAFDAAARHMSFAKAAEELSVTPAALSFQIKSLEEHLGQAVFRRLNRAVELTEAGRTLAPGVETAFQNLASAWRTAQRLTETTTLNVTAGPGFTTKWLAPRLYDFARANPQVELRFSATLRVLSFDTDEIDVAIRFGYNTGQELYAVPLAEEWITPVMTPEMAAAYPTPRDLTRAPLIFDHSVDFLNPPCDWPTWFRLAGLDHIPEHGVHFGQTDHAVDAALAGVGVVLGRRGFVVKDISEGRLVMPYRMALGTKAKFRFVCRKGEETRPQIAAFQDWILDEVDKLAYISDQLEITPVEDVPTA